MAPNPTATRDAASSTTGTVIVAGEEVTLPVHVRSARMVTAQWFVDADAAQSVIDYSGLRAVRQRGRAIVSVSGVQYLDNDLGPYNEIAIAFVVHPHDEPAGARSSFTNPTTFIHRLPVNQSFTCAAGREIWGFPKWVASISVTARGPRTDVVLLDHIHGDAGGNGIGDTGPDVGRSENGDADGSGSSAAGVNGGGEASGDREFVLGLSVARGLVPLPSTETTMSCYSWREGVLRRTPWITRNHLARARPGGATIDLGSRHPLAHELRSLGLPKRPFFSVGAGAMTATFGPPELVTL